MGHNTWPKTGPASFTVPPASKADLIGAASFAMPPAWWAGLHGPADAPLPLPSTSFCFMDCGGLNRGPCLLRIIQTFPSYLMNVL